MEDNLYFFPLRSIYKVSFPSFSIFSFRGPNIFFCFSNYQAVVLLFFLTPSLPSTVLQWHHLFIFIEAFSCLLNVQELTITTPFLIKKNEHILIFNQFEFHSCSSVSLWIENHSALPSQRIVDCYHIVRI